jgi:hypothetical protein
LKRKNKRLGEAIDAIGHIKREVVIEIDALEYAALKMTSESRVGAPKP